MDIAELHSQALDATKGVIAGVRQGQWAATTPCAGWDVRALGDIGEQLIASSWLSEFEQGRGPKQVRLGNEIIIATGLRGVEHLGNDGQPRRGSAGYPHRVVNGEFCPRQGARVVCGSSQPYGPVCGLDDLGTRQAVRSVPHRAGQRRDYLGLCGQRAVGGFQLLRGLAEKVEQLGILRA